MANLLSALYRENPQQAQQGLVDALVRAIELYDRLVRLQTYSETGTERYEYDDATAKAAQTRKLLRDYLHEQYLQTPQGQAEAARARKDQGKRLKTDSKALAWAIKWISGTLKKGPNVRKQTILDIIRSLI